MKIKYQTIIASAFRVYGLVAFFCMALAFVSCNEDILIDKVDEDAYSNIQTLIGTLRDASTGKTSNIVELFQDSYCSSVSFNLSRIPKSGVDIKVEYDASYADVYNIEHGTDFKVWPQDRFSIDNDGKIVVAPDEKQSYSLGIEITRSETPELEAETTYILPLKATVSGGDVKLSEEESHCVYLIKNRSGEGSAMRYPGEKETFLYFEVNDTNPLNALQFRMEDGRYLWNYVVLFAANINYNRETGELYVYKNPQVQYILDHNEEIIQPLRKRGIKVLLGLLGNHDESGLAQLSELGARDFAGKLAAICNAYNLDGVNFDDEYSNSPDFNNPLFTTPSSDAGSRLMYETKKAMPDKYVTTFQYSYMRGTDYVDGVEAGMWLDIAVANYGSSARPLKGMTNANCSYNSVEMMRSGYISEANARSCRESDYGYYMVFALWATGRQGDRNHFGAVDNLARGLYGSSLVKPQYYWPSPISLETKPISW